ncbi:MAG: glycerophosphodiester phosphodiesterase [Acidimicrobiaceae bacterium]|nr:glycerophosphodiester phosphodiesterase [Acidimicrobiaceae bacterium]MBO0748503.1 glycerophosphodiester phosphodiesterase [Acidimicrobiaceae bacterium]
MAARFAFLDHPGPIPFAHRGGALEAPENTVASFAHALSLGYRYLETDVRATRDGVVVAFHDAILDRVSERSGAIEELTWSDLARVELAGGERVSALDELLERWPEARWNIDAKHDSAVDPLIKVIRRTGSLDRVCLTSFSDRRITRIRQGLGPAACTGMGPLALAGLRLGSLLCGRLGPGRPLSAGAAQIPLRQGPIPMAEWSFLAGAHRAGVAVHVWTIDDEATMDHLLDLGVDGIMTDRPSLLRAVLIRRRLWVE